MHDSVRILALLVGTFALVGGCDDEEPGDSETGAQTDSASASDSADSADSNDSNEQTASDGDSMSGDAGRCAQDQAILSCDQADCAFEPADIDCAMACANVATLCASNDCDAQCMGMSDDPTLCGAACEASKGLNCSNVVFGCYAMDATCDGVGGCVDANR